MGQRTLEDQAQAMVQGYNSTVEWALGTLIQEFLQLKKRVDALDGGNPPHAGGFEPGEVIEGDPED